MDPVVTHQFFEYFVRQLKQNGLRYFVAAGAFYLIVYLWGRRRWAHRKIQQRPPNPERIRHEIRWSMVTLVVFGAVASFLTVSGFREHLKIYPDIAEYGWGYFALSIVGLIFFHDTYFYWTHRLLHTPWFFRNVHHIHHRSTDPTPFAAFSFHPIEAVIQMAFVYIAPLFVPFHKTAILTVVLYQMFMNTLGHLGYEVFPRAYLRHPLTFWQNTPTHHNMHHSRPNCNYGLYFNLWDRWMGTNHADYARTFEEVTSRPPEEPALVPSEG